MRDKKNGQGTPLTLKQLVCGGATPARQAQQDIAADWIATYGKYCPSAGDCPAYRATYRAVE